MSKAQTGVGDFVKGTNAKIFTPTITGGTATGQTQTNSTLNSSTLNGTTTNSGTISGGAVHGSTIDNSVVGGTTPAAGTFTSVTGNSGNIDQLTLTRPTVGTTSYPATGNFTNLIVSNILDLSNNPVIYMSGNTLGTHAYPTANFPGTTLVHVPIKLLSAGTWYPAWIVCSW